jgi:ankyrin repeat protein/beta-lactamase regulating signal transducer with metallopeptidase domain
VPTWLTDGSQAVACTAVAFLVHSTVLIALGLLLTVRSRRRSAAFRRTILRIAVVTVLVSPVAGALHRHSGSTRTVAQLPTAPAVRLGPAPTEVACVHTQGGAWPGGSRAPVQAGRTEPVAAGGARPAEAAAGAAAAEALRLPAGPRSGAGRGYDVFYVAIVAVLVLGAAALAARLARVYAQLVRASRRAEPAPAGVQREYERAARAAGTPVPRVLVSPAVRSPLVMGVVRPAVLLPAGAGDEGVACSRAIVLHELAHLRHRDCLWGLAVQVLCVVAPWQPLVWVLARRLGGCQEEACDDYVVWVLGRRREYARELVRVAQACGVAQQASLAAAGAVGYRSRLGRRVSRVLDATRRVRPGVKVATVLVLLALGGVVLFATGVLHVGLLWQVPQEVAAGAMELARAGDSAGLAPLVEEHRGLVKRDGAALLVAAAGKGHVEVCRFLLDAGVGPNRAVNEVTALLEGGARPSAQVVGGRTPLQAAAARGHVGLVRRLLAGGADPNARSEKGTAPIHAAASRGETECLQVLLEHGADPGLRDGDGRTALHHACAAPDTAALSLLLDAGAAVEAADDEGRTALHEAAGSGRTAKALCLLERGADPNARTSVGETPLHLAAASGQVALAHALLENGADVNARDNEGRTPLGAVTCLSGVDRMTSSPLAMGPVLGNVLAATSLPQMQQFLLANGAQYDALSAVALGSPADVERVVGPAESAPVYPDGSTLLHAAVAHGNRGMVKVLLGKGFDPELRNAVGRTAVDLAMERDDVAMANLLAPGRSLPAASAAPAAAPAPSAAAGEEPRGQRTAAQAAEELLQEGRETIAPIIAPFAARSTTSDTASTSATAAPAPALVPAAAPMRDALALAAVRTGDLAVLRQVLDAGADPEEAGQDGQRPLMVAVDADNADMARALLEAGADVNVHDGHGATPLQRAVAGSRSDMVQVLLQHGPDTEARDRDGNTPLLAALPARAEQSVELLLAAGADPNAADSMGRTPLEVAVSAQPASPRILRALLAAGARHTIFSALRSGALGDARTLLQQDPSLACVEDAQGLPPLYYALRARDPVAVRMLLDAGADPNARQRDRTARSPALPVARRARAAARLGLHQAPADTPMLMVAVRAGDEDVVAALLDGGADARSCRSDGLAPLHMAARARQAGMVPMLAAAGADPNADAGLGWRPLHEASARPRGAALQAVLVAAGADLNARDAYGRSALRYAVEKGMVQNAQALLGLGAEHDLLTAAAMGTPETVRRLAAESPRGLRLRSASLATPLHVAAERGDVGAIRALLGAGADPNARDLSGRSPLHLAAATGDVEAVVELLDGGADTDVPALTNAGATPLHVAAEQGLAEVVQTLLAAGANPNAKDEGGSSPLHLAAGVGDVRSVSLLLQRGADPDCLSASGATPLANASEVGAWDVVQVLLHAGADPKWRPEFGASPLYHAARAGRADMVSALLQAGADPSDASGPRPLVPLYGAVESGSADAAAALLAAGADPAAPGPLGQTPLHVAARADRTDLVEMLLDAGAPLDAPDELGLTPLRHAVGEGADNAAKLLLERGARHDEFTDEVMGDPGEPPPPPVQ